MAGPGANISHGLAAQVEPVEELAKYSLLRKTGVEDRRPYAQAEPAARVFGCSGG